MREFEVVGKRIPCIDSLFKSLAILLLMASLVFAIYLMACSSGAPAPVKNPETGLGTGAIKPGTDGGSEWDKLVAQARKEGKIIVVGSSGNQQIRDSIIGVLRRQFGLEMEMVVGRGSELAVKINTERRNGIYAEDVYIGGGSAINDLKPQGAFDPFPELLLPDARDPRLWRNEELTFVDKDKMMFAMVANPSAPIGLNTDFVRKDEIRSYMDLLEPKWRGKIVLSDPSVAGSSQFWFGAVSSRIMSLDYMRKLAQTGMTVIRDGRLQIEWLTHGKFLVALSPQTSLMTEFTKAGAHLVDLTPIEGSHLTSSSGNIALMNKAPHAAASKVFINWLLSKEGQTLYSKTTGFQSARNDVPTDHIDPDGIRQPGVTYVTSIDEEFLRQLPKFQEQAKEIFGPLMK